MAATSLASRFEGPYALAGEYSAHQVLPKSALPELVLVPAAVRHTQPVARTHLMEAAELPWTDRAPRMPFIGFIFGALAASALWSALGCGIWALWLR